MTIYETSILVFLEQLGHNTVGALEFARATMLVFFLKANKLN
jgi:hypothetical protein